MPINQCWVEYQNHSHTHWIYSLKTGGYHLINYINYLGLGLSFSDFIVVRFRQISPLIWIWLPLCYIILGIFFRQICHIPKDLTSTFAKVPLYFKLFYGVFSLDISVLTCVFGCLLRHTVAINAIFENPLK
jgi:hypothetical protein